MARVPPDPRYIFRGDMGCVYCVLFQVDSATEHLYAGTNTGNVHIWDLKTHREFGRIKSGNDSCLSLQTLNDDHLFIHHKSGLIRAYKKAETEWIAYTNVNIDNYHYCRIQAFSENEIVVPLKESNVGLLSKNTFKVNLKLNPSDFEKLGDVMVIKPLKDEKLILVGYEGGKLILWDVRQKSSLSSLTVETCPIALDFDTTLMKGIIGGPSNQLQVFSLSENHSLHDEKIVTLKNSGTSVITIRPDGKIVAVGGWDSKVRIFSGKSLKPLAALDQHRDIVQDIAYSSQRVKTYDNKCLMATAAEDGYIALWDIYN